MTAISFEKLQQESTRLLTLIEQYERTIEQQKSSIQNLHHQLHLFRSARFGRKSEKGVVLEQYAFVFDEAHSVETDIGDVTQEPQTETITYTRSKHKTGRKPLPNS